MDRLNSKRTAFRTSVTNTVNELNEELRKENFDKGMLSDKLTKLDNFMEQLRGLDLEMMDKLLDSDAQQEQLVSEIESTERYSDSFITVTRLVNEKLNDTNNLETKSQDSCTSYNTSENKAQRYKLPKLELKKFDGELINWLPFWSQFRKIHEDEQMHISDKFQYLIQCMKPGSRAQAFIESYPMTSENYLKAVKALQQRFGKKDLLTEVYVRELLKLIITNVNDNKKEKLPLSALYDKIEAQLRALESMDIDMKSNTPWLYPMIESCLSEETLKPWQRSNLAKAVSTNGDTGSHLQNLLDFLKQEVEGEERISLVRQGFGLGDNYKVKVARSNSKPNPFSAADLFVGNQTHTSRMNCQFCSKEHESHECRFVYNLTLEDRKKHLAKKGCCFACLRFGHLAKNCRSKIKCTKCQRRHFAIMCMNGQPTVHKAKPDTDYDMSKSNDTALNNQTCTHKILLQTLYVKLRGKVEGQTARVIIDTGSQRSYVSKRMAKLMGYKPIKEEKVIHNLFGCAESSQTHIRYRLYLSALTGEYNCNFEALDQEKICADIPVPKLNLLRSEITDKNIVLTDQFIRKDQKREEIDILIGADVAGKLLTGKVVQLTNGLSGVHTHLGWTVMGKLPIEEKFENEILTALSLFLSERKLNEFWDLETLGITDPDEKQSKLELEEATLEHFRNSVKRDCSGRYEVSLPWLEGHQPLPVNKLMAERRLKSNVKTLNSQGYLEEYEKVFQEWLAEGIIEAVDISKLEEPNCHYLPHRAVIRETSSTKMRPVFDASAKEKKCVSLNNCLEKGPNYIELIPSILNRFRFGKYGVTSDIRRAFLQIGINEKDRDVLRFLWWEKGNPENLIIFRHRRVVFGCNSSPFLLGTTLMYHLEQGSATNGHTRVTFRNDMLPKIHRSDF